MPSDLAMILPGVATALGVPGFADPLRITQQLAGARKVALVLLDGMGWHNMPREPSGTPTFHAIASGDLGYARPITTGFPSTTATSVVSLCTGVQSGAHGILGYTINVPTTDRVLVHTRWTNDPEPNEWQPVPSMLATLAQAGVGVTTVNRPDLAESGLTKVSTGVRGYVPAAHPDALATALVAALCNGGGRRFVYGYYSGMDKAGHLFGNTSDQWRSAAETADRLIRRLIEGLPPDAALIVTADHGQLDVPADRRIDIDTNPVLNEGLRVVAGEPRARYLHTHPGAVDDVHARWAATLGPAAQVLTRDQAIERGLFGPVRDDHRARIGDLVVICNDDWAIVATRRELPEESRLIGMHGGLTTTETQIPLIIIGASATSIE